MSIEREKAVELAKQEKYEEASVLLQSSFEKGDIDALSDIGVIFERNEEFEVALNCYEKASMLGSTMGTYNAANCYERGFGTEKDPLFSFLLYKKLSKQRFPDAFYKLSKFYKNGIVVDKDYKKALKTIIEGTKYESKTNSNPTCFITAGYYYETGVGTKPNYKKACKYYMKAAKQNSPLGMYDAALILIYKNKGKRIAEGLRLLNEAANRNYPDAYAELAVIYREGELVKKDIEYSDSLLNKGLKNNSWKAVLIYADVCLSESEGAMETEGAIIALAEYLANSEEYFEDYEWLYKQIKNKHQKRIDWEKLETNPRFFLEDNKKIFTA